MFENHNLELNYYLEMFLLFFTLFTLFSFLFIFILVFVLRLLAVQLVSVFEEGHLLLELKLNLDFVQIIEFMFLLNFETQLV